MYARRSGSTRTTFQAIRVGTGDAGRSSRIGAFARSLPVSSSIARNWNRCGRAGRSDRRPTCSEPGPATDYLRRAPGELFVDDRRSCGELRGGVEMDAIGGAVLLGKRV